MTDDSAQTLIASGYGEVSGGGTFVIESSTVRRIDRVSTMGMAFDGRLLARTLSCAPEYDHNVAEVVVYDARGALRYVRLDGVGACHDLAWDGDNLVVVSTWHNAVRWFSPGGELLREVRYPGQDDSWHINCLARHEGTWYATLFGPFDAFRGWAPPSRSGEGRLVELETGRVVVSGLTAPHSPRWIDGMWLVCNSELHELLAIEADTGRMVRRLTCEGWTRGLAYDGDFLYVGTSRHRASGEPFERSAITVIDRHTWRPVERLPFPAQEIYDLTFISREVAGGLQRGFDVNPTRTSQFQQFRLLADFGCEEPRRLWPSGDPLPWEDFRCAITAQLPATCTAGDLIELPVRITNRSKSFFTSGAPAPIYISYKWLDPGTGAYLDDRRAQRSRLPRTIFPNETVEASARIVVPAWKGIALLRVTLMQEGVTWFDDHDPAGAIEETVEIVNVPTSTQGDAAPIISLGR